MVVLMFVTRSAVPCLECQLLFLVVVSHKSTPTMEPAGLAGLKNPQLELFGAASMVAAVESMTVFRFMRSCTAWEETAGSRTMPVRIVLVRNRRGWLNMFFYGVMLMLG